MMDVESYSVTTPQFLMIVIKIGIVSIKYLNSFKKETRTMVPKFYKQKEECKIKQNLKLKEKIKLIITKDWEKVEEN